MKDFKQNTKMNASGSHYCGGGKVGKYAEGGEVTNTLSETQAESRKMEKEGVPSSPTRGQMPAVNMTRIAEHFKNPRKKFSEAPAEVAPKRSDKGADAEALQKLLGEGVKVGYKRGGKVKRGSK